MQPDRPMQYQDWHYELEKWTVYRQLPQLLRYDRGMTAFWRNLNAGLINVPAFTAQRNQPSLWTYFETLPAWCRESSMIRATLFALEYHKPHMDMRQKELAMNYTASMLRPIEGRLRQVLTDAAMSNKLRVTMDNSKAMMNELNFYTIDVADLGSDTELDEDDNAEKEFQKLLMGKKDEDDDPDNMGTVLTAITTQEGRDEERRKLYEEEMSISAFEMDPER